MSETARTSLVFDATGAQKGAADFKAAGERVIATEQAVAQAAAKSASAVDASEVQKAAARSKGTASAKGAAEVQAAAAKAAGDVVTLQSERIVKSVSAQATMLDRYARQLDPMGAAVQRYARQVANLNDVVQQQGPNAARASELLIVAQQKLTIAQQAAASATSSTTRVLDAHATSSKAASNAARDLGIQSIDVFSQMSSGAPIMTTLIQQGSQVAQVMAATGTGFRSLAASVGAAFASIARWIAANPLTVALTATTAGLVAMAVEAENTTRKMLNLQNQLRGVRDDYVSSAKDIEAAARHLAATTPLGTAEARAAGTQIALNPAFQGNQKQLEDLILLSHSLARTMGTELPDATALVVKGFDNAARAAQDLLDKGIGQTKGLTQAWVDSLKLMTRADAFEAFRAMIQRVTAGSTENITAMQKAWERFQQLATSDSQGFWHAIGQRIADGFAVALNMINDLIAAWQKFKNLTGGDEAERVRAQLAAQGGALNPTGSPGLNPRGWTANNPLNLMVPGTMTPQAFPNLETGVSANLQQLLKYQTEGLTTVEQIVSKWVLGHQLAPGETMSRELRGYIDAVQKAVGTGAINLRDPATAAAFFRAAQPHETGPQRLTEAQIAAGVQLGLQGVGGASTPTGVVSTGAGDINAAQAASGSALSARLAENAAAQRVQQAGIDAALAEAKKAQERGDQAGFDAAAKQAIRYSQALDDLRHAAADLIPEQDKIVRTLQESLGPLSHAAGASRTLAEVEQQFREAARGTAVDQTALTAALTAKQAALTVVANDNVKAIDTQTNAQRALISSYEEGGAALQHSMNFEQARIKTQETAVANTKEHARQTIALTEALDRQAQVQRDVAAAQDINKIEQQIAVAQKELDLINATVEVRTREIAIIKERQALGLKAGQVADAEQQKAIDAAAKYAALQQGMAAHQHALDTVANAFEQAFDQVGNSITQALVSGQGAAVNFRNVMTSVAQQILQQFLKLAVINPLMNSLFGGKPRDTLFGVFNELNNTTPGSSSTSTSGGGSTGIFGSLFSLGASIGGLFGGTSAVDTAIGRLAGDAPSMGGIGSWFSNLFSGTAGNASALASNTSAFGALGGKPLYHEGGIVGMNDNHPTRYVSAAAFANAPRFHNGYGGVRSDELPAVLQRGERVLTQRQDNRIQSMVGAMTEQLAMLKGTGTDGMPAGGDHSVTNNHFSIDARNSTPEAANTFRRSLPQLASLMSDSMARAKSRNG